MLALDHTDHDVNQLGFSVDRRRLRYDATAVVILQPLHIAVKNVDRTGEVVIPNGHHLGVQRVPVANENIEGNGELVLVTQRSARRARDIIKNVRLECVEATTLKVAARPSRLFRQPRDQTIRADPQLTALPDQPDIRFAYGKYRRGALVEPLYELSWILRDKEVISEEQQKGVVIASRRMPTAWAIPICSLCSTYCSEMPWEPPSPRKRTTSVARCPTTIWARRTPNA